MNRPSAYYHAEDVIEHLKRILEDIPKGRHWNRSEAGCSLAIEWIEKLMKK